MASTAKQRSTGRGDRTAIDFEMEIDVSGKLTSLGFRMIRSTVEKRTDQMIENILETFAESPVSSQ